MTKKERMYQQIEKHGNNLIKHFDLPVETNPIKLCKKLHSLENRAHNFTTTCCNRPIPEHEQNRVAESITKRLVKILGARAEDEIFINYDARGYALKLHDDLTPEYMYKDWGGYGIVAPDFNE